MTTTPIDKGDLWECFTHLARVCLFEESNGRSSINIKRAVVKITDRNEEASAIWLRAQADAAEHYKNTPRRTAMLVGTSRDTKRPRIGG